MNTERIWRHTQTTGNSLMEFYKSQSDSNVVVSHMGQEKPYGSSSSHLCRANELAIMFNGPMVTASKGSG